MSLVVNDPLAPPHAPADILFLIPGISWANILRSKRRSKTTATLGDGGACRQPGRKSNDNQFPIPGQFTGAQRLVPAPSAIPATAAKEQHEEDNDQKSCGVHFALLSRTVRATAVFLYSANAQGSAR